jgi:hypothetical protein
VITVAALLVLGLPSVARAGGPGMAIGAAEDAVRSASPAVAQEQMDMLAAAGFRAVRITQTWAPGETKVSAADLKILENITTAAKKDGIVVYAVAMNFGSRTTPLTAADQADFASYAASMVTAAQLRYLVVGNEPNLNRYWLPQYDDAGGDAAAAA